MNWARIKLFLVFCVFAAIGFGPVSPACLIGLYVIYRRPLWFYWLIFDLYAEKAPPRLEGTGSSLGLRNACFLVLLVLFVIDVVPFPVVPSLAFAILFTRPLWFYNVVQGIYRDTPH